MSRDDHWTKRRQRAAKCKIHGLHYDPELTSGCTLCRKEGLAAQPRKKPQMLVMLLSMLAIAVILYRVFGPGAIRAEATPVDAEPAAAAVATRLDPERYRLTIQAVDRALYETPAANLAMMNEQIRIAFLRLSDRLVGAESALSLAAADAVNALASLAETNTFSLETLQQMRADWALARSRHFTRAPWFLYPGKGDDRTDRAALAAYRDVASGLLSLADEGWSLAEVLESPPPDNASRDEDAEREQWQSVQTDWRERLTELRQQLPGRPDASADPRILVATQRLEQAFLSLSSLAAAEKLPGLDRIDQTLASAEQAQQSFDDLLIEGP